MEKEKLSLNRVFIEGWAAFTRRPWLSIGGYLLGSLIGSFLWPFIGGPMAGGVCTLFLKMARDDNPEIGDLFSCFKDYWRWTGIMWLWVAIYMVCYALIMPLLILNVMSFGPDTAGNEPLTIIRFFIIHILLIFLLMIAILAAAARWGFAFFEAVEGGGVMNAFRRSSELTKGYRLRLWLIMIVLSIFANAGVFALYSGMFVTATIAVNIMTAIYLDLKRIKGSTQAIPDSLPYTV
ncbi:MAG: hypothetical protein Q7N50_05110 [Armatimonadota bacterium]|nr:hypothetical protein [Armatimonadota bacterium]